MFSFFQLSTIIENHKIDKDKKSNSQNIRNIKSNKISTLNSYRKSNEKYVCLIVHRNIRV